MADATTERRNAERWLEDVSAQRDRHIEAGRAIDARYVNAIVKLAGLGASHANIAAIIGVSKPQVGKLIRQAARNG